MKRALALVLSVMVGCGGGDGTAETDGGASDAAVALNPMASLLLTFGAGIADTVMAPDGALYVVGRLDDPFDFGNGTVDPGPSGSDILLVRYDAAGDLDWVKNFGDPEFNLGRGVDLDAAGNVYIAGSLRGSADFGDGLRGDGATGTDVFIASFEPNGAHRWDAVFASTGGGFDQGADVVVGEDNVYLVGLASPGMDFGGGSIGRLSDTRYLFTAALNKNTGAHVWSEGHPYPTDFDSNPFAEFSKVALDSRENLFVSGYFKGRIDLGNGNVDSSQLEFGTGSDARLLRTDTGFVVSYTNAGAFRWLTLQDGDNRDRTVAVAVDAQDNVYAAGEYTTAAEFGGGMISDSEATSVPTNMFFVSYSNTGSYRFHAGGLSPVGGTALSQSSGLTTTEEGAYVSFDFRRSLNFVGETLTSTDNASGDPSQDVAVASFDLENGDLRWVRSYGGAGDERAGHMSNAAGTPLWSFRLEGVVEVDGTVVEPTTAPSTESLFRISE